MSTVVANTSPFLSMETEQGRHETHSVEMEMEVKDNEESVDSNRMHESSDTKAQDRSNNQRDGNSQGPATGGASDSTGRMPTDLVMFREKSIEYTYLYSN